ncbi:MAG: phosphotriesterase [Chitinophagaceae bacterium]|nr:phosphotriesterase [Chitinophagaceae bacterium]
MISRRSFLHSSVLVVGGTMTGASRFLSDTDIAMTVNGPIAAGDMGLSLIHEHILVDFIGADQYDPNRWNHDDVIKKALPYLEQLKAMGCKTLVDCTPNYLGRDVILLKKLSTQSGLQIITNTGYYGGSVNKFLPAHAFTETEFQLAERWIKEHTEGIERSRIYPGFIKISVNDSHLSDISKKLIRAAAHCHLKTGLTIASHTGPAIPAFEEIEILKQLGVSPAAFIWVHAQNEKDWNQYILAAKQGAWVSLDGLNENNIDDYVKMLAFLKKENLMPQVLVSHDAGWYEPGKADGGNFRGYTTLFEKLIPALKQNGFVEKDLQQLLQLNAAKAFSIKVRTA